MGDQKAGKSSRKEEEMVNENPASAKKAKTKHVAPGGTESGEVAKAPEVTKASDVADEKASSKGGSKLGATPKQGVTKVIKRADKPSKASGSTVKRVSAESVFGITKEAVKKEKELVKKVATSKEVASAVEAYTKYVKQMGYGDIDDYLGQLADEQDEEETKRQAQEAERLAQEAEERAAVNKAAEEFMATYTVLPRPDEHTTHSVKYPHKGKELTLEFVNWELFNQDGVLVMGVKFADGQEQVLDVTQAKEFGLIVEREEEVEEMDE